MAFRYEFDTLIFTDDLDVGDVDVAQGRGDCRRFVKIVLRAAKRVPRRVNKKPQGVK